LGRPGDQVWPEVWHIVGAQLNSVLETGAATYSDDQLLPAFRSGYLEESYFTYSYSPIHDESGAVGGVFTAVAETTERVIRERRLRGLRALGEKTASAATQDGAGVETVCVAALAALAEDRSDIPFAVAYARDPGADTPRLIAAMGLTDSSPVSIVPPPLLDGGWCGDAAPSGGSPMTFASMPPQWQVSSGANAVGDDPPATVALLVVQPGDHDLPAVMVAAGVTPYRVLDDEFRGHLQLLSAQVGRAIGDAQAYESSRRRAEALAQLDKAKSDFFANISHELRTPLTLIAAPVEDSLHDVREPLGPAQRQRLEIIHRNATRLRRLVDDLLDFASIEAGKKQPERQFVDLSAVTKELVDSFAPAAQRAGLRLFSSIDTFAQPIAVDVSMWEKIVLNLLSNAVKYTLVGEIEVVLRQDAGVVELAVRDTGVGIADEEQPMLFERFHRVRGPSGRSHEGTGIGLALVAEMVRLHGGSVGVVSDEGVGSTFTVQLPLQSEAIISEVVEPTAVTREAMSAIDALWDVRDLDGLDDVSPAVAGDSERPCVLVVEDNVDMRSFIASVLRPHWRVLQAADGREGFELARTHRPDLILTDVMMPKLDGFGLLTRLRADPRTASLPVIMLRAGAEAAIGGLTAGADDYLAKPFSTAELLARVQSNLEMAALRNRGAEFRRTLTESMQEGFFLADDEGTVIEANQAFLAMVGYDAAGLPYRWPPPWVPTADTQHDAWSAVDRAFKLSRKEGGGRFCLPMRHRDGHLVWIDCTSATVADTHEGRRMFVGTARDVTVERLSRQREATVARFAAALAPNRSTRALLSAAAEQLMSIFDAIQLVVQWTRDPGQRVLLRWPEAAADSELDPHVLQALAGAMNRPAASVVGESTTRGTLLLTASLGRPGAAAALAMELGTQVEDVELFRGLARDLAHALIIAREDEMTRAAALTFQHAILGPTHLPHGFAVRYTPAAEPLAVGGDWYDVVVLDETRTGIMVGDCVGHGLPAAAVMGQLRSAAQALLLRTAEPAQVLADLDLFGRRMPAAMCTTAFCAVIDKATSTIRYSSAGHIPPTVVAPGTPRQLLEGAMSLPLGTKADLPRPEAQLVLPAGATLLLYTDGLIERRGESLTVGIDRGAQLLERCAQLHPEQVADHVVTELMPPGGYDDDVAVLIYRHAPAKLQLRLPAAASNLAEVRAELRRWLPAAAIDDDTAAQVLVAVGEAASNCVEHANREDRCPVLMVMTAEIVAQGLAVSVADNGRWRPPRPAPHRGNGVAVMKALCDDVTITTAEDGTRVEMLKKLAL
jgi:PAS domain S-box-containing protein